MRYLAIVILLIIVDQALAQSIGEYFKMFPHKPDEMNPDSADDHTTFLIDDKNAYLSVNYEDADYDYEYGGEIAFTYFIRQDKSKVFGYSHFFEGPSSSSASFGFFGYSQGKWTDVTARVMPEITLLDFTSDTAFVDSVGSMGYTLRLALPQQGTSLRVSVLPVGENDNPLGSYEEYTRFIGSLPEIVLIWKKDEGVFQLME